MNNNEIEARIQKAFAAATPNAFDSVLSDCQKGKGKVINMSEQKAKTTRSRGYFPRIAAAAAVLVVAIGLILGGTLIKRGGSRVAAVVSLDVNPGIEMDVSSDEKVLAVRALNGDAEKVIGNMELEGSSLDVAVNALIGSMLKNGYISDLANSILISVDGSNNADNAALQDKLSREINALLEANALNGAVLSQIVNGDSELRKLAEDYGITLGKAQLIRLITENDARYSFDSLVPLTINQLNLLCEQFHTGMNGVDFVGHASDAAYIGAEAAKQAAITHSGVDPNSVSRIKCELDWDDGRMIYEVEFAANGIEYEYDIDAENGAVLSFESDTDENGHDAPAQTVDPALFIGEDEATRIALEHAGVSEGEITHIRVKLEQDDGIMIYDVKFYTADYEYDYEIDAASGRILDYDKEWEGGGSYPNDAPKTDAPANDAPKTNAPANDAPKTDAPATGAPATGVPSADTPKPTQSVYIGEAAAKQAALKHAGFTESQVSGLWVRFDYDDGRAVYDVEFYVNGYEYEYEIDALTGNVIEHDRERRDAPATPKPTPTQAPQQPTNAPITNAPVTNAPATNAPVTNAPATNAPQPTPAQYIGKEAAIGIALRHAGYSENQVSGLHAEFDYDDGRAVYDVEFHAGGYEYDYKIDARTGAVIHHEHERDDHDDHGYDHGGNTQAPTQTEPPASSGYIGEEAAKRIAFQHAGVNAGDVRELEVELEREHGTMVYKVEFKAGYREYEYEIDAVTGEIIEFDIDD